MNITAAKSSSTIEGWEVADLSEAVPREWLLVRFWVGVINCFLWFFGEKIECE